MSMSGTAVRRKMCETRNGVKGCIHATLFFFFLFFNTQFIFEVKRFPSLCSLFTESCAKATHAWLSFLQDARKRDCNHFGLKYTLPLHPLEHESRSGVQI